MEAVATIHEWLAYRLERVVGSQKHTHKPLCSHEHCTQVDQQQIPVPIDLTARRDQPYDGGATSLLRNDD